MFNSDQCPCCGQENFNENASVISPFIQEWVSNLATTNPPLCTLLFCSDCGCVFFKERFTSEESLTLYAGYRGSRYFTVRHQSEPWYTQNINDGVGESPELRKKFFDDFVGEYVNLINFNGAVLDYGGDRGKYISDLFTHARKYVFDISEYEPVEEVIKIASFKLLQQQTFDFIYLCNTLEHLSNP